MGLDLLPDPERSSNASRDHQLRDGTRAQYLYNNDDPEDWGSTASESESFDGTDIHDKELAYDSLETGGLTDREIDRLDGKTSSRLGSIISHSTGAVTGGGTGSNRAPGYPERDTGANTGPKGVIADQKYHHRQQLQERLSFQQAHNARMLARAPTTTTYLQDMERERQEKKEKGLLDEDDGNDTIKVFGSLMEMNAAQYVSAIDTEKKDVTVIIHIYSERNAACKKLDGYLIQLAGRYATTKFIRIKAPEVDFDEEVCPTVLVYRAGDLIANLVMITYELSEDYDDVELEELFTRYAVILRRLLVFAGTG
ncbi:thioredoxin-like protein [Gamsiella multidivaricata]|uniref:thioredoxin-like protein n=1 Tax=Gamsiella multidivaricata TaxID=101098 RepID=UPI00221E4A1D|nr:thioredoxin-like protein [Gamsiella multidivaricata]KAI7819720.1 thioredoxin-like protein [Gamsiella multidivaricata]